MLGNVVSRLSASVTLERMLKGKAELNTDDTLLTHLSFFPSRQERVLAFLKESDNLFISTKI